MTNLKKLIPLLVDVVELVVDVDDVDEVLLVEVEDEELVEVAGVVDDAIEILIDYLAQNSRNIFYYWLTLFQW
jgi:hypothetical protein